MVKIIFVIFQGGLGNQMFQYAFYRSLESKGYKPYACLESYKNKESMPYVLENVFSGIRIRRVPKGDDCFSSFYRKLISWRYTLITEKYDGKYDSEIFELFPGRLNGYWQSEKYFIEIENIIREIFQFNKLEDKLSNIGKNMENSLSVSIHIRGGDYLKNSNIYGDICTKEYYELAIKYLKNTFIDTELQFFVFTDDIEYAKQIMENTNATFMCLEKFEDYQDWYDMYMISCCVHHIIANSSFSWWGAWLGTKKNTITIAPKKWLNTSSTEDIWCTDWVRL